MSHFEKRVQLNKIIESQLPEFLVADFPKAVEFFKQYFISQEFQGGNTDLIDNLDRYIRVDNLVPEVVVGKTTLSSAISTSDTTITVASTKGFPDDYGLLKIDDEIITYTGKTDTTFTGCIRGFSGITGYDDSTEAYFSNVNRQSVIFKDTTAQAHTGSSEVQNLSALFLQEFYKKLKKTFTPGFEELKFVDGLDVGNFIKNARSFYQSKGIEESVIILFKVLYGVEAKVIDLETRLIKPSSADYIRRELIVAEVLSGDPFKLEGQTIFRSVDLNTSASVSDVEVFTRDNKTFYKIGLFVGYNERDLIEGEFIVPGYSKVLEPVEIGGETIAVDSTIGFPDSGTLISGTNTIAYTSKSISQFFGCTGVTTKIEVTDPIRANETVFGYENGDTEKKVELRITGVLSNFEAIGDIPLMEADEIISVKNVGEVIYNPVEDKTYKEVFANSWIYNTKSRVNVDSINGANFTLKSDIDKSQFRIGDSVDILVGGSNVKASADALITAIPNNTVLTLGNISSFVPAAGVSYSIRRNLKKSKSSGVLIKLGQNIYIANALNVYTDDFGQFGYVASHSLPGYTIQDEIVESTIPDGTDANLGGFSTFFKTYSIVKFANPVRFIDGDQIRYTATNPLAGLNSGETYYVKLVNGKEIYLYASKSLLTGNEFIRFAPVTGAGDHKFTLVRHEDRLLSSNNILRKIPLSSPLASVKESKRNLGNVGVLVDGVEISSPDSADKVYYGPIEKFEVLNGGRDYDVINPPNITVSTGAGSTAYVEPTVVGSVQKVFVDPQEFDIDDVESVTLTGGNGEGCVLEPIVGIRFREIEFDSRPLSLGGGVDITNETITFRTNHGLVDGQRIIYNQNGNKPIALGDAYDPNNTDTGNKLISGDEYVVKVVNPSTIKLHINEGDALNGNAGINTLGLSVPADATGVHKFRTLSKGNLREIKVLDGGSGYTHRKLRVKAGHVSLEYNNIYYKGHGFETGETVIYTATETAVGGLTVNNRYYVDKIDDDTFRLINLGADGTLTTELTRRKFVDFTTTGSGYHVFQYPPITINANVSYAGTTGGSFTFTPLVTGIIADAYLYESGTGYGSTVLNLHKKPLINVSEGRNAQLAPIIDNGEIVAVQVLNKGDGYVSFPDLVVEDRSATPGTGAILKPVLVNNRITDVVIINGGIGYSSNATSIYVRSRGFGAKFDTRVRGLHVNDAERFADHSRSKNTKIFSNLYKNEKENSLVHGIFGYSTDLGQNFELFDGNHSPIVGWAYDGNPIYGPFGYAEVDNIQSGVRIIKPGYELNASLVEDRPSFTHGFFTDDYQYTGTGDLDRHNGRFCKTPEFPNGIYAYFVGVTTSSTSADLEPVYPYFIGESYKSEVIKDNFTLDHSFDFNNSNLTRNTFPYNVAKDEADYDFFNEGYESFEQVSVVESVTQGEIDEIKVIDGGTGYVIGDRVNFDIVESGGVGVRGEVSEIVGVAVTAIDTTLDTYENATLIWDNDRQVSVYNVGGWNVEDNDHVLVTGLSTSIVGLNGSHKIGFSTETVSLAGTMTAYNSQPHGTFEDIFISSKFATVSAGSTITVKSSDGVELLTVVNDYNNGVLRVKRYGTAGVAHSFGSELRLNGNRITLPVKTKEFKSSLNKIAFFNAQDSVGVGTTSTLKTFTIGNVQDTISVPNRSIHLPNHPFKTGEKVIFTRSNKPGTASLTVANNAAQLDAFAIPDNTSLSSTLYVINKGTNYIGLATQVGLTTAGNGLYFFSTGSDDSEYKLRTDKDQITADVSKIKTNVSCGTTHGLKRGDTIKFNVVPSSTVGIGTSTAVKVKFNANERKLLINPTGITSSNIDTSTNQITIDNHGYKTGDKVYYESVEVASGLHTGSYFVIEDTSSKFRLAETLYESNPLTEKEVNIVGTGDTHHTFSLVNPPINIIRNNNLKFDLSDASLSGYQFKIYTDNQFSNEYVSSYDSRTFNVVGLGTIGVSTSASLTLNYSQNIPTKLFYGLEKSGYISTADKGVDAYSELNFIDSPYNGTYNVFGIGSTTFKFSPSALPEILNYTQDDAKLEYTTKSSNAINGSIGKVLTLSKGFNFDRLPKFKDVTSTNGVNANISAASTSIGRIKKVRFRDIGYDYHSDKTLRPEADVPPIVEIDNLDTIKSIDIESGGSRYLSDPGLILFNDTTKQVIDTTTFIAKAPNGAIAEVEQLGPLFGIQSEPHRLISINNSNGVGISSMQSGVQGIATCTLTTPFLGFSTALFAPGDEVFVEGVSLASTGTGYNSEDYDYKFFKVIAYNNASPATLTFQLVGEDGVGLTTNPGFAKTNQSGFAQIVNKKNYPVINVIQERSPFEINEQLYVDNGTGYIPTNLRVSLVRDDYIKIRGSYNLQKGAKIRGVVTGTIADVTNVDRKRAKLNISYSSKNDIGWRNDIGKISEDYQVTPDNDYYQNLSYSVKSPITWKEFSSPLNSIVHPAGLKNFADVGVTSTGSARAGLGGTTTSIVVLDVVNERRVDTINNFDNTVDVDVEQSNIGLGNFLKSNKLQIQNRKLTSFTECRTNRVLIHDDISDKFSSRGFQDTFAEIEEVDAQDNVVRYTIQIVDPDDGHVQLSELVLQTTDEDTFLFEKYSAHSNHRLGTFSADVDDIGTRSLFFTPTDPFETDHDIKILRKSYLYQQLPAGDVGIGTSAFGSVTLSGSFVAGITSIGSINDPWRTASGISSVKTLVSYAATNFNGAFASVEIGNRFNNETNYIEAFVDFDGSNTYLSEYYYDATTQSYSATQSGVLETEYDSSNNIVRLKARNVGVSSLVSYDVRSTVVGFAASTAGIGTYRYLLNNQPQGTEKSARYESTVNSGVSTVRIGTFDLSRVSSSNSIVRVSAGSSSAIHQVVIMANNEENDVVVVPGPFAPVNNVTGLGTFSGEIDGGNFYLNFHPDAGYDVDTQAYNEVFYREMDFDNQSQPLKFGPTTQNIFLTAYDGLNGLRANRTNFKLTYEGDPIYMKTFNPADTTTLNYQTGLFTYRNHFFNTGEELIYTPEATFVGVGKSAVGIGQTADYLGVVTDRLPSRVYPIAITPDSFKLATRKEYAQAGIFVTFTDAGLGNAHELEFTKKLTKTVVGLDGIVQQPIAFTPITHSLRFNNGGITAGISTFNISGISSIQPRDIIRIDDEYMKVIEVGLSTNTNGQLLGPINGIIAAGGIATHPTVAVKRAVVGSSATTHTDGATVRVYRGAFNIVKNEIHFIDPPKGNTRARRNESNLPYVKAEFSGRTFLRSDYDTNMLFDDISDQFTGIAKTYTATVEGINTSGVQPGNGILFINGVFQTPTTENNTGQNYVIERDTNVGISSFVFTGIESIDGVPISSDTDINQNQIPRGGLIVSLGSTPGLGYAPLVGAKTLVKTNASGGLTNIVGVNTWIGAKSISTARYNNLSGILEVETTEPHYLGGGDSVKLNDLEFKCPKTPVGTPTNATYNPATGVLILTIPNHGLVNTDAVVIDDNSITFTCDKDGNATNHSYPRPTDPASGQYLTVSNVTTNTFRVNVGASAPSDQYVHTFVSATTDSVKTIGGGGYVGVTTTIFPDHDRSLDVFNIIDANRLNVLVGPSSIPHIYQGGGEIYKHYSLNHGSGYRGPVSIGVTDLEYEHRFSRSLADSVSTQRDIEIDVTGVDSNNQYYTLSGNDRTGDVSGNDITIEVAVGDTLNFNLNYGGGHPFEIRDSNGGSAVSSPAATNNGATSGTVSWTPNTAGTYVYQCTSHPDMVGTITVTAPVALTPTSVQYTSHSGVMVLTVGLHKLTTSDTVGFTNNGLFFRCSKDQYFTEHSYPRSTDPVAGINTSITAITPNSITVNVGKGGGGGYGAQVSAQVGVGGSLAFSIDAAGQDYINPRLMIPEPNYENMEVTGVSRLGIGSTTATGENLLLNLTVGAAGTEHIAGTGATMFNIDTFKVVRNGYAFQVGDVLTVSGLVTAAHLTEPVADFQLEVTEVFNDFFSSWSFGELDYIDSVAGYQDGIRTRFPLYYENDLLSFELDPASDLSSAIDLDAVLVIFINGVLQKPGYAYNFTGGTSFTFSTAPKVNDKVDIFFYVGKDGVDVGITTVTETVKVGDDVFIKKHPLFQNTVDQLTSRTLTELLGSDTMETPTYTGPGINSSTFKPFDWIKQKKDKFINGDVVYKTRNSIEPLIFPTAKIIGDVNTNSTEIFVDNAQFFDYDEIQYDYKQTTFRCDALIVSHDEPVAAAFTATVNASGSVDTLTITNPGAGYTGSTLPIAFAAPKSVGVGVGTTATATATVSAAGTITSVSLTNAGFGYTSTNPPNTIIEIPSATTQSVFNIANVQGFSGIITGIAPATGSNGETAIKFMYNSLKDYTTLGKLQNGNATGTLVAGYPIVISDTKVGNGVTSVYSADGDIVSIGTTFLDNIYIVDSATSLAANGEVICNVQSTSVLSGITSTGSFDQTNAGSTVSLGRISWGRIYNFQERVNPIAIGVTGLTYNSGLNTHPTIQRRGDFGEFNTGAVLARKPRAQQNAITDLYVDNILPFYGG